MTKEQHPNDIAYSNGYKQGVFDTEMRYQIIDTPEATGFSRVVGNEDWEDDFRKQFDELKLKPPKNSMKNAERELIIWYFRNLLTTKDQEKEETIKSIIASIDAEIIQRYKGFALDAGEVGFNDGLRRAKYIISRALPTEDNN